ncbi:MAG: plasmid pRiA4b ORF-3 family protein, partial [Chthoniobacteraceae bacterium]
LAQFSDVVLAVMGWSGGHLHSLDVSGARFEMHGLASDFDDEPGHDEAKFRLLDFGLTVKDEIHYEYDFGDGWEHSIGLKKILPPAPDFVPVCLEGARACPPEDCGGIPGFYDMLETAGDPAAPEHEEICEWLGDFDPERFDLVEINAQLAEIARSWKPSRKKGKRRR